MNLLLAYPEECQADCLTVRGRRAEHMRRVLRVNVGDALRVGLVRQAEGQAEVVDVGKDAITLGRLRLEKPGAPPQLRLIIALPRPKALRRLLQTAASFGVAHIDIVNAWRVDKSYWGSPFLEPAAMQEQLWLGCEQGRHVWLPTVRSHRLLVPFLDNFGEGEDCQRFLAQPGSERWLGDAGTSDGAAVIAIGPEGGWINVELASFAEAGFEPFAVSRAILRSEIALAAALAQWELVSRRVGVASAG